MFFIRFLSVFTLCVLIASPAIAEEVKIAPPKKVEARINKDAADKIGRYKFHPKADQAMHSKEFIKFWSSLAASETMRFGFHDYQEQLQDSSSFFTKKGWDSFVSALEAAKTIEALQENKQVVIAEVTGPAEIVKEGAAEGRYEWEVNIPVTLHYIAENPEAARAIPTTTTIKVVRTNDIYYDNGIGIEQWISVPTDAAN